MRQLKVPAKEDFDQLTEAVEFNEEERAYFDEMIKRSDAQLDEKDYRGKIDFYLKELEVTKERFGKRVAVQRRLMYMIGHAHEWLGTYVLGDSRLEGGNPLERAEMFEQAILWYQAADETVGFFTDYSLRQSESCGGAAHFRTQAGVKDEITEAFSQRQGSLITTVLGGLGGGKVIVFDGPIPEYLKQKADKEIDGAANAYFFKDLPTE